GGGREDGERAAHAGRPCVLVVALRRRRRAGGATAPTGREREPGGERQHTECAAPARTARPTVCGQTTTERGRRVGGVIHGGSSAIGRLDDDRGGLDHGGGERADLESQVARRLGGHEG